MLIADPAAAPPPSTSDDMPLWGTIAVGASAAVVVGTVAYVTAKKSGALDFVTTNKHQVLECLKHPTKPWLAFDALGSYRDAMHAQVELFGKGSHIDDSVDGARHAMASAFLKQRMMQKHGMGVHEAEKLTRAIGVAHELDGKDNPRVLSPVMDKINNWLGMKLVHGGTDASGGWLTREQLRDRTVGEMNAGRLARIVGDGGAGDRIVRTTAVHPKG